MDISLAPPNDSPDCLRGNGIGRAGERRPARVRVDRIDVAIQSSPTALRAIRVSVILPSAVPSCSNSDPFDYYYSDANLGKTWTVLLLAAQEATREVAIDGTGTCDRYGDALLSSPGVGGWKF